MFSKKKAETKDKQGLPNSLLVSSGCDATNTENSLKIATSLNENYSKADLARIKRLQERGCHKRSLSYEIVYDKAEAKRELDSLWILKKDQSQTFASNCQPKTNKRIVLINSIYVQNTLTETQSWESIISECCYYTALILNFIISLKK